jgi:catechol 2,3-dioxygenase-like lactoylglutathione lyase family enzyme
MPCASKQRRMSSSAPADFVLDHIIIFVRDLARTERAFTDLMGLQITSHADHPGFGTRNGAIAFELGFLELLTDAEPDTLRSSRYGRVFLERRARRGDGPAVFVFQTPSIDDVIAQCRARGGLCEDVLTGYSRGADGIAHQWKAHLMPGTEPVYLDPRLPVVGRARTWPAKTPGDHPLGVRRVEGIVIAVTDLAASAELYRAQLGLIPSRMETHGGVRTARFELPRTGQYLVAAAPEDGHGDLSAHLARFGEGIHSIVLGVRDLDAAVAELERRGGRGQDVSWLGNLPATDPGLAVNTRLVLCEG